jgi:TPR repeat protein
MTDNELKKRTLTREDRLVGWLTETEYLKLAESEALIDKGDYDKAIELLVPIAEKDCLQAQVMLGALYFDGGNDCCDSEKSFEWFKRAAEFGDAHAQFCLANCYNYDKENSFEAFKWYYKSAEQGYGPGELNLGHCYAQGYGVEKDPVEAVKWYRKAAEKGFFLAFKSLANCYANGVGVEKDEVEAAKLEKEAGIAIKEETRRFVSTPALNNLKIKKGE